MKEKTKITIRWVLSVVRFSHFIAIRQRQRTLEIKFNFLFSFSLSHFLSIHPERTLTEYFRSFTRKIFQFFFSSLFHDRHYEGHVTVHANCTRCVAKTKNAIVPRFDQKSSSPPPSSSTSNNTSLSLAKCKTK